MCKICPKISNSDLESYIQDLCKKHKIIICKKRFRTAVGRAWISSRHVKIPLIRDIESFMVALHEIGHVITNKETDILYMGEYKAEIWAFKKAKKLKISCPQYTRRAKWYVLSHLAVEHNKKGKLRGVPKDVKKFVEENTSNWKGYDIKIYYDRYNITITKKLITYTSK